MTGDSTLSELFTGKLPRGNWSPPGNRLSLSLSRSLTVLTAAPFRGRRPRRPPAPRRACVKTFAVSWAVVPVVMTSSASSTDAPESPADGIAWKAFRRFTRRSEGVSRTWGRVHRHFRSIWLTKGTFNRAAHATPSVVAG